MKRDWANTLCVVLGVGGVADAAMLRMQWRGLGPDDAEIELALHEAAIIDIYFEMDRPEETLGELSFRNQDWGDGMVVTTQTETEAAQPGWTDSSVDDFLGAPDQLVAWIAEPGYHLTGPGEFLIGSQTIRLDVESPDWPIPVTFDHDLRLLDASGDGYTYAQDFAFYPGYYGYGLGKPYYRVGYAWTWDPLFVITVPEPASIALLAIGAVAGLRRTC